MTDFEDSLAKDLLDADILKMEIEAKMFGPTKIKNMPPLKAGKLVEMLLQYQNEPQVLQVKII